MWSSASGEITMVADKIRLPEPEWLAEFCKSNHIRKLSVFGSVLRNDFHPGSDVDLLVEYEPAARVGYFAMMRMEDELANKIGREVDLRTPEELSKHFRQRVLDEAEPLYVH